MSGRVEILVGDCRDVLKTLPAASVHCIVTSPPYFGLRDYGVANQIGLEPTPDEFVAALVGVMREARRVLRDDGTAWVNLGDSYASSTKGSGGGAESSGLQRDGRREEVRLAGAERSNARARFKPRRFDMEALKPKDLIGIPWRVAFALQADGWYLRQDIIWSKPNPMPESVTDRCTKAHEYIFLLSKSARYYFDAEAISEAALRPEGAGNKTHKGASAYADGDEKMRTKVGLIKIGARETRNKRSVWTVASQPFSGAHFATFPPALIEPCILAGTSEKGCCAKCGKPWVRDVERKVGDDLTWQQSTGATSKHAGRIEQGLSSTKSGFNKGSKEDYYANKPRNVTTGWSPSCSCDAGVVPCTVLDPFFGAGTTGLVADRLGRNCIGIELNPAYADIALRRVLDDAGMFGEVA